MGKENCWDVMNCGRELNGINAARQGVCPAAQSNAFDGVNMGTQGGRFCWGVAGTYCDGDAAGSYAQKLENCINCKFLKQVNIEEGRDFILSPRKIKSKKQNYK